MSFWLPTPILLPPILVLRPIVRYDFFSSEFKKFKAAIAMLLLVNICLEKRFLSFYRPADSSALLLLRHDRDYIFT